MSSERAGVHTSGALNREAATDVLKDTIGFQPNYAFLDALEACVVPDPRLARIEALCNDAARQFGVLLDWREVRAILRGNE